VHQGCRQFYTGHLDPHWHIFSEFVQGTFADYVAMPKRNAIPLPDGISALNASVLGTAWLTAYRALFTRSRTKPGQTLLVQGASGERKKGSSNPRPQKRRGWADSAGASPRTGRTGAPRAGHTRNQHP
jgi:hypothetical protein